MSEVLDTVSIPPSDDKTSDTQDNLENLPVEPVDESLDSSSSDLVPYDDSCPEESLDVLPPSDDETSKTQDNLEHLPVEPVDESLNSSSSDLVPYDDSCPEESLDVLPPSNDEASETQDNLEHLPVEPVDESLNSSSSDLVPYELSLPEESTNVSEACSDISADNYIPNIRSEADINLKPKAIAFYVPPTHIRKAEDGTAVGIHQLIQMSSAHLNTARFVPRGDDFQSAELVVPLIPVDEVTAPGFIYDPSTNSNPLTTSIDGRIRTKGNAMFAPASTFVDITRGSVTYSAIPNKETYETLMTARAGLHQPPSTPDQVPPKPESSMNSQVTWPSTSEGGSESMVKIFIPNTPEASGGRGKPMPSLIPTLLPTSNFIWIPPGFTQESPLDDYDEQFF